MNILNWPDWNIISVHENDQDYLIVAETGDEPGACPHCGAIGESVRYGKKRQTFMDLPVHGKRVGIRVVRRRYRCYACGRTFLEPLAVMDGSHQMTKRLSEYVAKESLDRTFVSLADMVGIHEKTVRLLFKDYVAKLARETHFETPSWMGIDEVHILKQPRCIITNVQEGAIIDMLPNRRRETVEAYLRCLPDAHCVRVVTMDMWNPYKDAVHTVLPQARIVVDRFHIVRMASYALETVRKGIRANLSPKQRRQLMHDRHILLKRERELYGKELVIARAWFGAFPLMKTAYDLKESFYSIWEEKDRHHAVQHYYQWEDSIPEELRSAFAPVLTAMENWREEILTYFEWGLTNAYTESLNGLVKMTNRIGRGYSFEVIRAKMLYSVGLHKVHRPKYEREWQGIGRMMLPPAQDFGVSLSTLVQKLEEGDSLPVSTQFPE